VKRIIVLALLGACGTTGQEPVSLQATATGTDPGTFAVGDWDVTLDRADVGFGPVYFCATAAADAELCQTAVVELRATVPIDALDPAAQTMPALDGVTGSVHSATFDYGVSWMLPDRNPGPDPGAPDGHSLVLDGTAVRGADVVTFHADVDARPTQAGTLVMKGFHTAIDIEDDTPALVVHADPSAWLGGVDFDDLLALGTDVDVPEDSRTYSAIVGDLTSVAPVTFTWNQE